MEKKYQVDDSLSSSTAEDKTSIQNQRESEVSVISSAQQNSLRNVLTLVAGPSLNRDRNDSDSDPIAKAPSLCSKESSDLIQLSSADSIDQNTHQSNENMKSDESSHVREPDSSHITTKSDPSSQDYMRSKHLCKFDLNDGMEANGVVECTQKPIHGLKPISVVAKYAVPVGLPEKPLQFAGKLGWKRSAATISAFRPITSKISDRENGGCESRQSLASQGIDLNIAARIDSDDTTVYVNSKQAERFFLDLNCQRENGEDWPKQGTSGFDLSPGIEDKFKSIFAQNGQSMSYFVNLSSMHGFHQVQERMRMLVPLQSDITFLSQAHSRVHVDKVQSLSPTFYPAAILPHLNNQHPTAAVIPGLSCSVVAAYPRGLQVLDSHQLVYPAAYVARMRPTFVQNGSLAFKENGSRGGSSVEFLAPTRNALFEERMKATERVALPPSSAKRREPDGGWDYSQANYRPMASWN